MSKFTNRIPKSPRELERFYLETADKLKATESTLEDVESLLWQLFSRSQQQGMADELSSLRADLETRLNFLPNHQQEIQNIIKKIEDMTIKFSFIPNHEQEIRAVQHQINDSTTMHFMRI